MLDHTTQDQSVLSIGNGGWVRYQTSRLPNVATYRRYDDIDGRLEPVEMYVESIDDTPLTADLIRALPLGRIDAWVGAEATKIRSRLAKAPGPDLRRAARHYATYFNPATTAGEHWVADMFHAQWAKSAIPQAPMPPLPKLPKAALPAIDATLDVPAARPFGDDFYRQVAELYRQVSRRTRAVAGVIADANRVEVTQVHRWVKVARAKGFLPPTTRGKVG